MSAQLIPVFQGELSGISVQLVDARVLHSFLEIARDFTTWIKNRISEYGFVLNLDYLQYSPKSGNKGKPRVDYHITLDMAKELSMVERNEKGKQARRYFIECEQRLLNQQQKTISLLDIEKLIDKKLTVLQKTDSRLREYTDKRKLAVNVHFSADDLIYVLHANGYVVTRRNVL